MIKKHIAEDLPEFLHSYETEKPFTHCLMCNTSLNDVSKYAIEKVFKRNKTLGSTEIIYEYAVCFDCAVNASDEISEESMQSIQQLYQKYSTNMMMKLEFLHGTEKYSVESWTERCSFTGKESRLCSEFSISAIIENGKLVYEHSPIMVSDQFMEELQECMSKKTRDYFDGFKDEYFDVPPEIKDLIGGPTVGII